MAPEPLEQATVSHIGERGFTGQNKAYGNWKQKCRQRALRALAARYPKEFDRLVLEAQLDLWDERPDDRSSNVLREADVVKGKTS